MKEVNIRKSHWQPMSPCHDCSWQERCAHAQKGALPNGLCFFFLGIGKTTLIRKASEVLKSSGVPVDGFYTEEVRQGGKRIGFDVVTLSGLRGPLSRVGY